MKTFDQVVKNTVNGLFMKKIAEQKGWSKQDAANKVIEYVNCAQKISIADFMASR